MLSSLISQVREISVQLLILLGLLAVLLAKGFQMAGLVLSCRPLYL